MLATSLTKFLQVRFRPRRRLLGSNIFWNVFLSFYISFEVVLIKYVRAHYSAAFASKSIKCCYIGHFFTQLSSTQVFGRRAWKKMTVYRRAGSGNILQKSNIGQACLNPAYYLSEYWSMWYQPPNLAFSVLVDLRVIHSRSGLLYISVIIQHDKKYTNR